MTLPRKLAFRDKFVYRLIQEIGIGCEDEPIVFPDNTTPIKFIVELNEQEFTKMYSALMTGADLSYPDEAHDIVWLLLRQLECPVTICDELIECLSPFFDSIETKLESIETKVDAVQETLDDSAATPPEPITENTENARCGGAAYVVDAMNLKNEQIYLASEESLVDNVLEAIPVVIELVPFVAELPFDELFELVNTYFENQYLDYQADFILVRDDLIGSLACFIEDNGNTFTYQVWGDWLAFVGVEYSGNRAAELFGRYSPLNQSFINQIIEKVFNKQSLQDWFKYLYTQFYAGTQDPIACPSYICPADTAKNVGIFALCGTGVVSEVEFTDGVPFELTAYENVGGAATNWVIALKLPGNYEVTLNSITGTITPPADLAETAYAWFDPTTGFTNVLWNAPAEPDEFGTHDTTTGIFEIWCATQEWNVMINNSAPFSASFTVTAI